MRCASAGYKRKDRESDSMMAMLLPRKQLPIRVEKIVDRRPISGIDKIPIAVTINVKYSIGSGPADAISVGDNVTSIDADRKTTVSGFLGSGVPDSHRPKCHAMVIESVGDRSGSNV